jgi:hypothetical protein
MSIPLSPAQVLSSQTPVENYQLPLYLAYNIFVRTTQKTQLFHCCSPTVVLLSICCLATGTCLPSRCPETPWYIPLTLDLCKATALHASMITGCTKKYVIMFTILMKSNKQRTSQSRKETDISISRGANKSLAFPIFIFAAQPKEYFFDGLKKLEQRSRKCVKLKGNL